MTRIVWKAVASLFLSACVFSPAGGRADGPAGEGPLTADERRPMVAAGLRWLDAQQHQDGHWDGEEGELPVALTALAGIALLMESNTASRGRHAENLRKAENWLIAYQARDGLIGDRDDPDQWDRYMIGHGFALLFLAGSYGEEKDADRRRILDQTLTKAVAFSRGAQAKDGGWGEFAASDEESRGVVNREGPSEVFVTLVQVQVLRAARQAGLPIPPAVFDRARDFLGEAIDPSLPKGDGPGEGKKGQGKDKGDKPVDPSAVRAAAVAALCAPGPYDAAPANRWLKSLASPREQLKAELNKELVDGTPNEKQARDKQRLVRRDGKLDESSSRWLKGLWEEHGKAVASLRSAYFGYGGAQLAYYLGDDGCGRLFPDVKPPEGLTWSGYRKRAFRQIRATQYAKGGWGEGGSEVGATALSLIVLQLEDGAFPALSK